MPRFKRGDVVEVAKSLEEVRALLDGQCGCIWKEEMKSVCISIVCVLISTH